MTITPPMIAALLRRKRRQAQPQNLSAAPGLIFGQIPVALTEDLGLLIDYVIW